MKIFQWLLGHRAAEQKNDDPFPTQMAQEYLEGSEFETGAADLIRTGSVAGEAGSPRHALRLRVSGDLGATVELVHLGLCDEPPDYDGKCCLDDWVENCELDLLHGEFETVLPIRVEWPHEEEGPELHLLTPTLPSPQPSDPEEGETPEQEILGILDSRGARRREAAVDELLEIAKLADNHEMRAQLEALASRFSLPPGCPDCKQGEGS